MKRIGLLGGMSWESSAQYYCLANEEIRARCGGLHSADLLLRSVDFAEIEPLQRTASWEQAGRRLGEEAQVLQHAGAQLLVLCTNTMHKVADLITEAIDIPLIHIADATAMEVRAQNITTLGLLATRYTMEDDFYIGRLRDHHGLSVLVPGTTDRNTVHDVIFDELCRGVVRADSRDRYRQIMRDLIARGAEGILLGCTEIDLLIGPDDSSVPIFDTTAIHVRNAITLALE